MKAGEDAVAPQADGSFARAVGQLKLPLGVISLDGLLRLQARFQVGGVLVEATMSQVRGFTNRTFVGGRRNG